LKASSGTHWLSVLQAGRREQLLFARSSVRAVRGANPPGLLSGAEVAEQCQFFFLNNGR